MASKGKGKELAYGGKRKRGGCGNDKSGDGHKRRNREVLQFFEDAADVHDNDSDDSIFGDDDFMEEEFDMELKVKKEPEKVQNIPFVPKEEEMDEEEFDKMMEERYGAGPGFVTYAEDAYENKRSAERNFHLPSDKDPTIWKVKCMVGRERHSAFCLMQKFVDLKSLGTKLQIISAFAIDHVKGFIYIEANKECDIIEACKGLCSIYSTRVAPVPRNEVSHLISVRTKHNEVTEGMWVRVKNGKYKGDLAQIVAVNDARKKATVKLIPRIDLQVMAQKFGGGVSIRNADTPAPRLISPSELEEFRPLIQYRRDRDMGQMFEVLDGLMLKDGYLYKKVSVDSLSCWGVVPSEEELLKFRPSENNESDNMEWLTQLYGGRKKKRIIGNDKSGEKGESLSGSRSSFELYDLVCIGRKDFGLIVGMEKDDCYKILKYGPDAHVVVTVGQHEMKNGPSDMKFTALDHCKKTISVNDAVKVLEGPLKDRQGIAKQIYRGIVFIFDENETQNGGYFCSKAQICEKIKPSFDACYEKDGESGPLGFEDFSSSPKSPLSPKKPWQAKENNWDKGGIFSIGQTLRIRIGPLKGYICRVLAIRRSDVTVKLDSKQKVLTVKCEHLSEVHGKNSAMSASEDPGSSSFKPFDLLRPEGGSRDCTDAAGTSTEGDGWNAGGLPAERSNWSSFPASGLTLQPESNPGDPSSSADNELKKDATAWERKVVPNQNFSWGASAANNEAIANSDQVHGWGKTEDRWNRASANVGSSSGTSDGWGKAVMPSEDPRGSSDAAATWDKGKNAIRNPTSSWSEAVTSKNPENSWGKSEDVVEAASSGKNETSNAGEDCWNNKGTGWNQHNSQDKEDTWGKAVEGQNKVAIQGDSWAKTAEKWGSKDGSGGSKVEWNGSNPVTEKPTEGWGNACGSRVQSDAENTANAGGWMGAKVDTASQAENWGEGKNFSQDTSWTKGGSSNQNQADGWNKLDSFGVDGGSSWNKQGGESSWGKQEGGVPWSRQDGGYSWSKQDRDEDFGHWNKAFDGGRGSGDRKGRVGGQGGRDQCGRGTAFGGQSSGWNKEGEDDISTGDGTYSKVPSSWSSNQANSWGKSKAFEEGREDGWKKSNSSGDDSGSGWNKSRTGVAGPTQSDWGTPIASKGDQSSKWDRKAAIMDDNQPSGWGSKSCWDNHKSSQEKCSGWNQKSAETEKENVQKDQLDGWIGGKAPDGGSTKEWVQSASWKGGSNDTGGADADKNPDSAWGKNSNRNSDFHDAGGGHVSDWRRKGNWNSVSSDAGGNSDSAWSKKSNWNSGFHDAEGNQSSGWGKKSNWSPGTSDANQDSGWAKKSNLNSGLGGGWKEGSNKNTWASDLDGAAGNNDSDWGKKSTWSSASSDASGNADSAWGKKSNWSSWPNDAHGNQDTGWGKKSNWGSGTGNANQGSGWGKEGNWNSGPGGATKESGWGKKSNWNSGSVDATQDSFIAGGGEDQTETNGNRAGGGCWSGSSRGRGGSDRGGFRGRGDRGRFGGRNGSDRGGYGGKGRSDRGGFGGRGGSDRGGFRGRGGSERGGFGGRGGSERGGFAGRSSGRKDQNGRWNENNHSADDKSFDWKNGANNNGGEWKSNNGGGSWNQGGGDKGQWKGWHYGSGGTINQAGGWSSQGSGSNQPAAAKDGGIDELAGGSNIETAGNRGTIWKSSGSSFWSQSSEDVKVSNNLQDGWNKGQGSNSETAGKQGNSWKSLGSSGSSQSCEELKSTNDQRDRWDRAQGSSDLGSQGSGWKTEAGSGDSHTIGKT